MKQIKSGNVGQVTVEEKTLQKQIRVGQTISKINALLDIIENLSSAEYDGVQKLNILIQVENKLIDLIEEL